MTAPLLYLLQANVALLLFATVYYGLLRRLTFFGLNRAYLLFALVFALVGPALPALGLLERSAALPVVLTTLATPPGPDAAATEPPAAVATDWPRVLLLAYAAGTALLLIRLLLQLLAMWRLHQTSRPAYLQGQPFRQLTNEAGPFSFWRTVYLNPARHPTAELATVLRHEQVHVRQWHTLDVLLAQLLLAAAWCNPAAWLLRQALLDNLEYLADHAALQTGLDRQAYQYSLLRLSHGTAGPSLVSHFTFSTLKNRVVMMNTPTSSRSQLLRYLAASPLVLALGLGFATARAQGAGPVVPVRFTTDSVKPRTDILFYLNGLPSDEATVFRLDGDSIANVEEAEGEPLRQIFGAVTQKWAAIITTKGHVNSPAVLALNEKIARTAPAVVAERTEEPAAVSYLAAPALAYITKNYPGYRLMEVKRVTIAAPKQVLYKAQIASGRRPINLLFDEHGQFVPEK